MKDRYLNREIDQRHNELLNSIKELRTDMQQGFKDTHQRQDETNGRVRWLEKMMWLAMGAISVLTLEQISSIVSNILV